MLYEFMKVVDSLSVFYSIGQHCRARDFASPDIFMHCKFERRQLSTFFRLACSVIAISLG